MTEDNSKIEPMVVMNSQKEVSSEQQGKSGGTLLAVIAVLLSLLTAAFCGYVYYIGINQQNYLANQLTNLNHGINLDKTKLNNQLQLLDNNVSGLESQVHSITAVTNNNLVLLQLNQLIGMANQSLVVYSDSKSALKLLDYVAMMLEGKTQAQYVEVKAAVNSDITKLTALQYVDATVLVTKLNALNIQISDLPLIDYDKANKTSQLSVESGQGTVITATSAASTSLWSKFWHNLKKDLQSIVVISSTDSAKALQLLPDKEIIIRENIKLYLLNAKIAVLQHDQASWVFNLQSIKTDLTTYFSKSSINTALIGNLDELINVNITLSGANIDASIKALNKLNNLQ
jgi:uncharacterized protein HemX